MSAIAQEKGMLNYDPATTAGAAAPAAPRTPKWWLRNWRLRYKMAAVLLVPTIAALGVGGFRIYDGLSTQSQMRTIVEQVELAQRTAELTHELQRERDFAVIRVSSGGPEIVGDYNGQNQRVDAAAKQVQAVKSEVGGFSPEVRVAYDGAVNRIRSLSALRGTVNAGFTTPQTLVAYDSMIDSVLEVGHAVANSAVNTEASQAARATEALGRAKEQLAQQRSVMLAAALHGSFLNGQSDAVRATNARFEAAYAEFEGAASPEQRALYAERVAGASVDESEQIEQTALIADTREERLRIDPQQWGQVAGERTDLVREVEQQMFTDVRDEAESLAAAARVALLRDSGLVLLMLVVAFLVAAYIARSVLRPLRTLRHSAMEIAQTSLPETIAEVNQNPSEGAKYSVPAVPVYSEEEIGQVARTFDAVNKQALRLAMEQALLRNNINDLFVNLARRSQTLVQRQLALIDQLEQDEQDPDQLSSLFELDHLATRMRRNNENLLILGGTDLTRRMMRPVPLNEVLGAAVSEVEQYARVAVVDAPELALQGRVVNDFVHLVAELLENATVFSNPDTEVTVRTAYRRQELVVEIRDRGVGIDASELGEINERLSRPPELDVAVSRRMGLFVVGQLARRHNIRVELHNNDGLEGGVTATVGVSGDLVMQLTADGPKPMPDSPQQTTDERRDMLISGEAGPNLGLAAAFGGRAAATERPALDPPTERAPLPELNGIPALPQREPRHTEAPAGEDGGEAAGFGEAGFGEAGFGADPPQYPVTVSAGTESSFGATDVPRWDDDTPEHADGQEFQDTAVQDYGFDAAAWPADGNTGFAGQFEVAGPDASADLFHSPFEAEKTASFIPSEPFGLGTAGDGGTAGNGNGYHGNGLAAAFGGTDPDWHQEDEAWANGAEAQQQETEDHQSAYDADDDSRDAWDMDDAPTQRLPIYEAVLSQWFRESDVDDAPVTTGSAVTETATATVTAEPARSEPHPEPEPVEEVPRTTVPDPGWGFADVGWKAAEALLQPPETQETTEAGLPKRVPRNNLVPGSAAPRSPQAPRRKPATPRSADAVRGRMSNFQQGVRRGRHAKSEVSTELPRSNPSHPEEQE